jgi:hypothetical protein
VSINKTIFPGFVDVPELEKITIGYSENASLLTLSMVSKTARKKLDNAFFVERFWQQHPYLAKSKDKRFVNLFENHPTLCGRILCGTVLKGRLKISLPFFIEGTSKLYQLKQSQNQLYQSQKKEVCGSGYKDPKSPIHQAFEKMSAAKRQVAQADELYDAALKRLQAAHHWFELSTIFFEMRRQPNHYFSNAEIAGWLKDGTDAEIAPWKRECFSDYYLCFRLFLMGDACEGRWDPFSYPDFCDRVVQMQNDEEYKLRKKLMDELNKCTDHYFALEGKRRSCEKKIVEIDNYLSPLTPLISKPSHLRELKAIWPEFRHSEIFCKLIRVERLNFLNKTTLKEQEAELKRLSWGPGFEMGIDELSSNKRKNEWLNRTLNSTYSSILGKRDDPIKRNYLQLFFYHQRVLKKEFKMEVAQEAAVIQASILEECLPLIQEAIKDQESGMEPSLVLLDNIRSHINSLERAHRGAIWGDLYRKCAKGTQELKWSERRFPKFLVELHNIVTIVFDGLSAVSKADS